MVVTPAEEDVDLVLRLKVRKPSFVSITRTVFFFKMKMQNMKKPEKRKTQTNVEMTSLGSIFVYADFESTPKALKRHFFGLEDQVFLQYITMIWTFIYPVNC